MSNLAATEVPGKSTLPGDRKAISRFHKSYPMRALAVTSARVPGDHKNKSRSYRTFMQILFIEDLLLRRPAAGYREQLLLGALGVFRREFSILLSSYWIEDSVYDRQNPLNNINYPTWVFIDMLPIPADAQAEYPDFFQWIARNSVHQEATAALKFIDAMHKRLVNWPFPYGSVIPPKTESLMDANIGRHPDGHERGSTSYSTAATSFPQSVDRERCSYGSHVQRHIRVRDTQRAQESQDAR